MLIMKGSWEVALQGFVSVLAGPGGVFTLTWSEHGQSSVHRWLLGQSVMLLLLCLVEQVQCPLLSLAMAHLSSSSWCEAGVSPRKSRR